MDFNKWLCSVHGIECLYGHPCYECKRETDNPWIIEKDKLTLEAKRKINSKPVRRA